MCLGNIRKTGYKAALMRDLSEIYGALADETRLRMMALLFENQELCVCDFVAALQITQSKASRHLRILRQNRLLDDRKDGLWVHYRLALSMDSERCAIVEALRRVIAKHDLDALRARLRAWLKERRADAVCEKPPRLAPLSHRSS
jgi:ArsR family transcriptional regulator, arsenate/arsenite/antimonite-responsive transcriptional repressor